TIHRDPREPIVKITIQNLDIVLKQGEWSEWIPLSFALLPHFAAVHGMVRIYVQQVHPHFRLYLSPINIDPTDSELPIANPAGYSRELSDAIGRFYTQGFPEDTKALSHGIFTSEEFLQQSKYVLQERLKAYDYELNRFDKGLFFFYFSSLDQNSHVLLRTMDPGHPLYEPDASPDVKDAVYYFYQKMDDVLRQTLAKMDSRSSLIILSDHGFAPFTREFHLSTWLVDNGFTVVTDADKMFDSTFYDYVDWSKTKAFAMGLNSIYINLVGREKYGAIDPKEADKVKAELIARLEQVRDPATGRKVLVRAHDARQIYRGAQLASAPDIILGYAKDYRISDEAALGGFPRGTFGDRLDKWSADHCMDPSVVPGVFLFDRDINNSHPAIWDLAPTIIKSFGLQSPDDMDGKSLI
ncbi:alkaline phosphatase family protein, partial [candidate division KSB1 bacterium]|nr:alkaline phosphatase family protein [candidate division KSB1 bacterium]